MTNLHIDTRLSRLLTCSQINTTPPVHLQSLDSIPLPPLSFFFWLLDYCFLIITMFVFASCYSLFLVVVKTSQLLKRQVKIRKKWRSSETSIGWNNISYWSRPVPKTISVATSIHFKVAFDTLSYHPLCCSLQTLVLGSGFL